MKLSIILFLLVSKFLYASLDFGVFNFNEMRNFSRGTASQQIGDFKVVGAGGGAVVFHGDNALFLKSSMFNVSVIRGENDSVAYFGTANNGLYSYNLYDGEFVESPFFHEFAINDMAVYNNNLYLATDKGLVLADKQTLSPSDFVFNTFSSVDINIKSILIVNDSIILKTNDSMFYASINSFLGSHNSWHGISDSIFNKDRFLDKHPFDGYLENSDISNVWYKSITDAVFSSKGDLYISSYNRDGVSLYTLNGNKFLEPITNYLINDYSVLNMAYVKGVGIVCATGETGAFVLDENSKDVDLYGIGEFPSDRIFSVSASSDSLISVTIKPKSIDGGKTLYFEGGVSIFNVYNKKSYVYTNDTNNVIASNSYTYSNILEKKRFSLLSNKNFPASWWSELLYSFYKENNIITVSADGILSIYNLGSSFLSSDDDSLYLSKLLFFGLPKKIIDRDSSLYFVGLNGIEKYKTSKAGGFQNALMAFEYPINDVSFYNDSIILVASDKGVHVVQINSSFSKKEEIKVVTEGNGLSSNSVKFVREFNDKIYFIGDNFINSANINFRNDSIKTVMNHCVYPNPLYLSKTNKLYITDLEKNSKIYLYTVSGRIIYSDHVDVKTSQLTITKPLKNIAAGIYILVIVDDNKKSIFKLMIL